MQGQREVHSILSLNYYPRFSVLGQICVTAASPVKINLHKLSTRAHRLVTWCCACIRNCMNENYNEIM